MATWRRGFFRLWLVLSVPWIVGSVIVAFYEMWAGNWSFSEMLFVLAFDLALPVTVYVLGLIVAWVTKGFK